MRTATSKVMTEDWLYTDFDQHWWPSDAIENYLSKIESQAARLFDTLHAISTVPTVEQWVALNGWLALTACRHPIIMRRGYPRAKDLAYDLADVFLFDGSAVLGHMQHRYGDGLPSGLYDALAAKGDEALLTEAEEIEGLSSQDPRLPMVLALTGMDQVAMRIAAMNLHLHDVPPGKTFVLGDAPVALSGLSAGFATPLSSRLAFVAMPGDRSGTSIIGRTQASEDIVDLINRDQAERATAVVVGPDPAVLKAV